MNITPRKSEVAAVLAVLDATDPVVLVGACEADDRAELGKALIKAVYAAMLDRDCWVYAHLFESGALTVPFGPFTSETEAKRFAKKVGLSEGRNVVAKVYAPAPVNRVADMYPAVPPIEQETTE